MPRTIDFNCDLGEGAGDDVALLPYISSASIACGFHAGNPQLMRATLQSCAAHGVAIGAHPSYEDRENFGRATQTISANEAYALVLYQIGALAGLAQAAGLRMNHVKPHGALYNDAARQRPLADAIVAAVRDFDPGLILYGLAGSALVDAGSAAGLQFANEAFAERRYEDDATLTPRSHPDACFHSTGEAIQQVQEMLDGGVVTTRTGQRIAMQADSLCLHGDRTDAMAFARELRIAIEAAGCTVRAPERRA